MGVENAGGESEALGVRTADVSVTVGQAGAVLVSWLDLHGRTKSDGPRRGHLSRLPTRLLPTPSIEGSQAFPPLPCFDF